MTPRMTLQADDEPTEREQVLAVFGFGGLSDLTCVLSPVPENNGTRRAPYPPLLQYAVAVTARIYGSQRRALHRLGKDGLWLEAIAEYSEAVGIEQRLPLRPPTQDQQNRFVEKFTQDPDRLRRLSEAFTASAVAQASSLDQFPEGEPDFARPDPRNTVFGDGTFYDPFSDVQEVIDPVSGLPRVVNSRATTQRPRLQRSVTDPTADGKTVRGVNHVTVQTRTWAGWIILANAQALGAEVDAARPMIDTLHDLLGEDRLHAVVWDRAISGWHLEDLMARQRILAVTKSFAKAAKAADTEEDEEDADTDHDAKDQPGGKATKRKAKKARTKSMLTAGDEAAVRLYKANQPLPLGTSVYRKDKSHEVVHGRHYRYGQPLGVPCSHDLWVDDGALVDVRTESTKKQVKVARAEAIHAIPFRDGGTWHLDITWSLPCEEHGTPHVFQITWNPVKGRHSAPRKEVKRALRELSVLSREDGPRFHAVHGQRNHTESYNSWAKARLGTTAEGGRAMRLAIEAQMLDHICTGTLANALTERAADILSPSRDQALEALMDCVL